VGKRLVHAGVEIVRAARGIRYRRHAHCRERLDRAQHVEHDAATALMVEAKVLPRRSREQGGLVERMQPLDL
jgi:hypothetical protein